MPFDSSTVITPSFPTFSIASAIRLPIVSLSAEMEATWEIASLLSTGLLWLLILSRIFSTALSMPRFINMGLVPAVTFLIPCLMIACASKVADVVPSPATSCVLLATSLTNWAPMFSKLSSSSISRAMVTPSLVIWGEPNFLSSTTLRPFGPRVTFTVLASLSTPFSRA